MAKRLQARGSPPKGRAAREQRRVPGSGVAARQMRRVVASDRTEILYHGERENLGTFGLTVGEGALAQISIVTVCLAVILTPVIRRDTVRNTSAPAKWGG
jgi:hypothetical protein